MTPFIFAASIVVITFGVWFSNRMGWTRICPICAGVFGTWAWIVGGIYAGILAGDEWRVLATMAMGGSVVGFAYFMEKHLAEGRSRAFWKAVFIPTGFLGVYGFLSGRWLLVFGAAVGIALAIVHFFSPRGIGRSGSEKAESIKKSLEDCC